jgi:hypothetical protein
MLDRPAVKIPDSDKALAESKSDAAKLKQPEENLRGNTPAVTHEYSNASYDFVHALRNIPKPAKTPPPRVSPDLKKYTDF